MNIAKADMAFAGARSRNGLTSFGPDRELDWLPFRLPKGAIGHPVNFQGADYAHFYFQIPSRRIQSSGKPLLLLRTSNVAEAPSRIHRQVQNQQGGFLSFTMHCRALVGPTRWRDQLCQQHRRCMPFLQYNKTPYSIVAKS